MNSRIIKATAYSNGEVAYISWKLDAMINGCLGFEITRIYPNDTSQDSILAAWVPFKGQTNPNWKPQNTSVWPVQKLSWRDLTLVKKRDQIALNPQNTQVQYLIRPIVAYNSQLEQVVTNLSPDDYKGAPVKLSYLDKGNTTNIITVGTQYGDIRATFTNGILATQWLAHTLDERFPGKSPLTALKQAITVQNDPIRKYLTGEVLNTLKMLLNRAGQKDSAKLRMALYELADDELVNNILAVKDKVEIILSNTSKDAKGHWDTENSPNRQKLKDAGIKVYDRYFNNAHIGHNKFVIYLENDEPKAVMMGSTNWTPTGLCAQSNNAAIIESTGVAQYYNNYWELLKADTALFKIPDPVTAATNNAQGTKLRAADIVPNTPVTLNDGTKITVWFSPNTIKKNVDKKQMPPDLAYVYSLMRKADKAIFFAVFLPGRTNSTDDGDLMTNIVTEAIDIGIKDSSLLIYGAISDPTAMPNYVTPTKKTTGQLTDKQPTPTTYDNKNIHIVRAYNFRKDDLIENFEAELYSAGHAIIHDKIIVIDPFSENATVIFGSHNLGFKASYGNDENLVIVQNNPALVQAYAVHVLDIYEHYRTRAVQAEVNNTEANKFDGFLSLDDEWLKRAMASSGKGDLADYLCGE